MKHIVCLSGGESSGVVAMNVVERYGNKDVTLLNHDINPSKENIDIKRFKMDIAAFVGVPITYANIGGIMEPEALPDQFDVCVKADAIVNPATHEALCTSRLKTEPFYAYLKANFPQKGATIYYGFDANEMKRVDRRRQILGMMGFETDFPLALWADRKYNKSMDVGIRPPLTYELWKHANCVGCLKAGLLHWYVVYCTDRTTYNKGIWMEEETGYTIHTIIRKGEKIPISLKELAPYFCTMQSHGVKATEHQNAVKFARALDRFGLQEPDLFKPCNCSF